jgi:Sec7-like guanine-nucleotide exchange factor
MSINVKDRRINKPQHIRALMQEQINILRQDESLKNVERARAIAYLSTVALTAISQSDLELRLEQLENEILKKVG